MKASVHWIRELLSGATRPELLPAAVELAERLTAVGLEIEGSTALGAGLETVVVAQLVERRPHPKADRSTLVKVTDGTTLFEVVCGAANVPRPGGLVALAKVGTHLPGGMAIEPREVRGERSAGMLCSLQELGLADASEGILVLDEPLLRALRAPSDTVRLGAPVLMALGLDDTILEVNVPPNRGDCLSHLGLAREAMAALPRLLSNGRSHAEVLRRLTGVPDDADGVRPALELAASRTSPEAVVQCAIQADASAGCGRYVAWPLGNVTVRPSPLWLQLRLRSLGLRAISNVVDVTNYVLLERGQPLHAFDAARLTGGAEGRGLTLTVRRARADEPLTTLDGVTRTLSHQDLVIADGAGRAVALAGVMGGAATAVDDGTTQVVLESAQFAPGSVRHTARRLGLHSDASHRFERGVDLSGTLDAARRAAQLLRELAGAARWSPTATHDCVDLYPAPPAPRTVALRPSYLSYVLATAYDTPSAISALASTLSSVGLSVADAASDTPAYLEVAVPSYRNDVAIEEDLVEEVARLAGYDALPATLPEPLPPRIDPPPRTPPHNPRWRTPEQLAALRSTERRVRDQLTTAGLLEVITYGFTSAERIRWLDFPLDDLRGAPVALRNPLTEEQAVLRTTLLPGLLKTLRLNLDRGNDTVRLFEVGTVVHSSYEEEPRVAVLLCGRRTDWLAPGAALDFFDVKGLAEGLGAALGLQHQELDVRRFDGEPEPYLHPRICAELRCNGQRVGVLGEVHPAVSERNGLDPHHRPVVLDLSLDPTRLWAERRPITPTPPPRFPAIARDLSLLLDESVAAADVGGLFVHPLLERASIVEDYRDPAHVPPGKKALLWSLTYRAPERTLTDAEVGAVHDELLARAVARFSAERR